MKSYDISTYVWYDENMFYSILVVFVWLNNYHAGESKRPIAERTPNSWETERPIDNILIEMAQEAGRYPCLELNN